MHNEGTSKASNTILVSSLASTNFTIRPNPGKGHFTVNGNCAAIATMKLISPEGKLPSTSKGTDVMLSSALNAIVAGKPKGSYVLQLASGSIL